MSCDFLRLDKLNKQDPTHLKCFLQISASAFEKFVLHSRDSSFVTFICAVFIHDVTVNSIRTSSPCRARREMNLAPTFAFSQRAKLI